MSTSSPSPSNPTWLQPVVIIICLCNYLFFVPSAIRFMHSTWTIRTECYMRARHLKLTLMTSFSLVHIIMVNHILLYLYFFALHAVIPDIGRSLKILCTRPYSVGRGITRDISSPMRTWLYQRLHISMDIVTRPISFTST